jgi:micrococcal nuclease
MKWLTILLWCSVVTCSLYAETGKVVSVMDGNTLIVKVDGEEIKILLEGIDCPELDQAFGMEAKKYLEKLVLGKEVRFVVIRKDRKGNRLAEVIIMKNGADPRVELLKQGLAWVVETTPIEEFVRLESSAKEKGKGLWSEHDPTPPWIFRRQQSMLTPKSS